MAKFRVDVVLEVWGCVDVEADSLKEAYKKVGENASGYSDLRRWNDGSEAQLRTNSDDDCISAREYELGDVVAKAKRNEV